MSEMNVSETREVELFGGAMVCRMPTAVQDISRVRQVPDNQEVYMHADTGVTVIVELLSRQEGVADTDAARFFYLDLARDNGCHVDAQALSTTAPDLHKVSEDVSIDLCVNVLDKALHPLLTQLPDALTDSACAGGDGQRQQRHGGGEVRGSMAGGVQRISKYSNEKGCENVVSVNLAVLRLPPPVSTEVLLSLSAPMFVHPESSDARTVRRVLSEGERAEILRLLLASIAVRDWGLFVLDAPS